MDRYARNYQMLTKSDNQRLSESQVCVVGCGGLGGYILEMLARIGIGKITAIDGDVFDITNLNRQLLSNESNIGTSKAGAAKQRIELVNSEIEVTAVNKFLDRSNGPSLVKGHDVVIDALDNPEARRILEEACEVQQIPMIHGAIAGWYGQVAVIHPGDKLLARIYPDTDKGEETELGNPSFTPATVASIQVAECIKLLLGKGTELSPKVLTIDLLNHEYDILEI